MTRTGSQGTQIGTIRNIVTQFMAKCATLLDSPKYHDNAPCDLETEIKVKGTPWDGRPLLVCYNYKLHFNLNQTVQGLLDTFTFHWINIGSGEL